MDSNLATGPASASDVISASPYVDVDHSFYIITASAGKGERISPSGSIKVISGGLQASSFLPEDRYMIAEVYVNGEKRESTGGNFILDNITEDTEQRVVFASAVTVAAETKAAPHCFICGWFHNDISPWCRIAP